MTISFTRKVQLAWKLLRFKWDLPLIDNELNLLVKGLESEDAVETQSRVNDRIRELTAFLLVSNESAMKNTLGYVTTIAARLAQDQLLSPLTGGDEEWVPTEEAGGLVNKRKPTVFKKDGVAYDSQAIGLVYPDGFVSYKRVEIKFPYWPETQHVQVDRDGVPVQQQAGQSQGQKLPQEDYQEEREVNIQIPPVAQS